MGKPKKTVDQGVKQNGKTKKKAQLSKMNSSDDEQVDDVMAWGRKKQNYYREDEDQYSSLEQEEREAQKIYKNQYDNYLNEEQLYDIPVNKQQTAKKQGSKQVNFEDQFAEDLHQQQDLPQEYIRHELEWVLQLFKDLQFYQQDGLLKIYDKLLKSYLTELKIPYIQLHPIIPMAVSIKEKITKLMKKLTLKQEEQQLPMQQKNPKKNKTKQTLQDSDQAQEEMDKQSELDQSEQIQIAESEQQDGQSAQDHSGQIAVKNVNKGAHPQKSVQALQAHKKQHQKGLQFYNQIKAGLQEQKRKKKQQKKQQRQGTKKPAFKQVNQNQGRFASQLILKNKGLIKKRKKIEGNSRVKLRKKFEKKKAIHRAKTGHFIRQNPGRGYEGESNIRTGKIAGVKLK